jgi:hypothetical protein
LDLVDPCGKKNGACYMSIGFTSLNNYASTPILPNIAKYHKSRATRQYILELDSILNKLCDIYQYIPDSECALLCDCYRKLDLIISDLCNIFWELESTSEVYKKRSINGYLDLSRHTKYRIVNDLTQNNNRSVPWYILDLTHTASIQPPIKTDLLPFEIIKKEHKFVTPAEITKEILSTNHLNKYSNIVLNFMDYLEDKSYQHFMLESRRISTGKEFVSIFPYIHRWTDQYRLKLYKKFNNLQGWIDSGNIDYTGKEEHPDYWQYIDSVKDVNDITFVTLTTYKGDGWSKQQIGESWDIERSFIELYAAWDRFTKMMRKYYPNVQYIGIPECHLKKYSGYPHIHAIFFCKMSDEMKHTLKTLYKQTGSYDHGLDFKPVKYCTIANVNRYIGAYMSTNFIGDFFWYRPVKDVAALLVYHAIMKYGKFRGLLVSQDLGKVISIKKEDSDPDILHYRMTLVSKDNQFVIFDKDSLTVDVSYEDLIINVVTEGGEGLEEIFDNFTFPTGFGDFNAF